MSAFSLAVQTSYFGYTVAHTWNNQLRGTQYWRQEKGFIQELLALLVSVRPD